MIYAAVLPVPFLALAIIDFPAKARGMHSSYTGDGLSNPFSTIPIISSSYAKIFL
jgi:hypothetical protein